MWLPFNLRYEFRRILAGLLARTELHRVESLDTANGKILLKTRRRASHIAVSTGNLYLRMQRAGVEVLTTDEWLRWELAVWTAKNSSAMDEYHKTIQPEVNPCIRSNGLMIPRSPGEPLSHILADDTRPIGSRLQCVGWALQSLEHVHALNADWGNDLVQPISHGDATAENVIIDTPNRSACWIDFDTRHRPSLRAIERQADDLRALVFSTAFHLPQSQYQQLSVRLRDSYNRREAIEHFRNGLSNWHRPNTFQLAQAPLRFASARALRDILVADL